MILNRRIGGVVLMSFDMGGWIAIGCELIEGRRVMREAVDAPYGRPQLRAAVHRLVPKYRTYIKKRYPGTKAPAPTAPTGQAGPHAD